MELKLHACAPRRGLGPLNPTKAVQLVVDIGPGHKSGDMMDLANPTGPDAEVEKDREDIPRCCISDQYFE